MTTSAQSQQASSTRHSVSSTPHGDLLVLAGDIDDSTRLEPIGHQLQRSPIIDLGGVTFINSVGVREWITLLDALARRGLRVTLRNVSEPMVRQMGMVMEARGEAAIESFLAPYVCNKCGDERSLLIDVATHRDALAQTRAPALPCAACGAAAELDEFPNRYLAFLT